jgi:hypothetical protein
MWHQQKVIDSKSSAYLHGTSQNTKKYQTVILVRELSHLESSRQKKVPDRNIGTRIIAP